MKAVLRTAGAALAAAVALPVVGIVGALAALARPHELGGTALSADDRQALAAAPARRGYRAALRIETALPTDTALPLSRATERCQYAHRRAGVPHRCHTID